MSPSEAAAIFRQRRRGTLAIPSFCFLGRKKRPGTAAWWTRREIKENTRDPFNNLFAYDYRKNTEREMLIFVLVFFFSGCFFFLFSLQSHTPSELHRKKKKKKSLPGQTRHNFFLSPSTHRFGYVMTIKTAVSPFESPSTINNQAYTWGS